MVGRHRSRRRRLSDEETTVDLTLIAVTLLSLFLAIAMGVVAWRLVQEERRRSDARLAALAAELGSGEGTAPNEDADPFVPESRAHVGAAVETTAESGRLFSSPVDSTPTDWGRLAAVGGAAAVVLAVAAVVFLLIGPGDGDVAATTEDGRPPLDLMALGHAAEGPFLDIRGRVRNASGAADIERLSVVAMAFDAAGTLVATRRTPVESPALPPGADSAFTVRLLAAGVSRYRISFVLDDTTIAHVDRRPAGQPSASTEDSS